MWWDPSEGGWGVSLADHGTEISGVLFGYASASWPSWLLIPTGSFSADKRVFYGDLYTDFGVPQDVPADPDQSSMFRYGSLTIDFAPPDLPAGTALMQITMLGSDYKSWVSYTKAIQRLPFGDAIGSEGPNRTDLWQSPVRSDWGLALAQHGQCYFGGWYTHADYNNPQWYFFSGSSVDGGNTLSAPLFGAGGVYSPASPFDASQASTWVAGSVVLNFAGAQATFAPTLNGKSSQWPIAPAAFGTGVLGVFCASPTIAPAPTIFTASPIALDKIRWLIPLGNLNPPGHTQPSDHMGFTIADPDARESPIALRTEVVAPGTGTVTAAFRHNNTDPDTIIYVKVSDTITYYLDHVAPDIPLAYGTVLQAGQHIGMTGTSAIGIDLGLVNQAVTQSFANPARYLDSTIHADGPIKYFGGALQRQLYLKTHRIGTECDGRIAYDIPGRLSGNWFVSPPNVSSLAPYLAMSFVGDTYDPSVVRVVVPYGSKMRSDGTVAVEGGVMSIAPGDPRPSAVTPATGPVVFTLTSARTNMPAVGAPLGYLL
jgi:hypothetical protein